MIKRCRFHTSITGVADDLEQLYEAFPEFRGKTPNKVFNIAVKEWLSRKLNKEYFNETEQKRELCSGFLNSLNFNILDVDHLGITSSKTTVTLI